MQHTSVRDDRATGDLWGRILDSITRDRPAPKVSLLAPPSCTHSPTSTMEVLAGKLVRRRTSARIVRRLRASIARTQCPRYLSPVTRPPFQAHICPDCITARSALIANRACASHTASPNMPSGSRLVIKLKRHTSACGPQLHCLLHAAQRRRILGRLRVRRAERRLHASDDRAELVGAGSVEG